MFRRFRLAAGMLVLAALLTLPGNTVAYIARDTGPVVNRFDVARNLSIAVRESFDGVTKSNVCVENTGDMTCYIRAEAVFTLVCEDGTLAPVPAAAGWDYSVSYTGCWIPGADGYWYYPYPVAPGAVTQPLIGSCTDLGRRYGLSAVILAQAVPAPWVEAAWGVVPDESGAIMQ